MKRISVSAFWGILFGLFVVMRGEMSFGEMLTLKLEVETNVRSIEIGAGIKEIMLEAKTTAKNVRYQWTWQGPGQLQGDLSGSGIFYVLPETIAPSTTAQAIVNVTVIDEQGNQQSEQVTFTLTAPVAPTATPTPFPTATPTDMPAPTETPTPFPTMTPTEIPTVMPTETPKPTPKPTAKPAPTAAPKFTPTPETELERLSREADACFTQKKYLTPAKDNAFDRYKRILRLDPEHRQALRNLHRMAQQYKAWGDDRFDRGEKDKAKRHYESYMTVAEYLIERGAFQGGEEYDAVKRRVTENEPPVDRRGELGCPATASGVEELLQVTLPANLSVYQQLKTQEAQGDAENTDVIWAIKTVLCNLIAIEDIYQQEYESSADTAYLNAIERLQNTYQTYKQEFDQRINSEGEK